MRHHEINSPPISISIPPPAIGQHPHILSRLHHDDHHHHHHEKENCETCLASSLNLGNVQQTTTSCQHFSEIPLEKKHLLLRKMLIVLLHAKYCREKDMNNNNDADRSNTQPCPVPFCDLLKGVLNHLIGCQVVKGCTFKHCSTSRLILEHWLHCEDKECPMCDPVRKTFDIGNAPFSKSNKKSQFPSPNDNA